MINKDAETEFMLKHFVLNTDFQRNLTEATYNNLELEYIKPWQKKSATSDFDWIDRQSYEERWKQMIN